MTMANPTELLQQVNGQVSNLQEYFQQQRIERAREQQRLSGIKWMEWTPEIATPATSFTIQTGSGPVASGYWLDLRVLSFKLSASDSVACYKGENATSRLFAYGPPPGAAPAQPIVVVDLSKDVLWKGEPLFFTTSGTGNIVSVYLTGWQVPAEEQGKLY